MAGLRFNHPACPAPFSDPNLEQAERIRLIAHGAADAAEESNDSLRRLQEFSAATQDDQQYWTGVREPQTSLLPLPVAAYRT